MSKKQRNREPVNLKGQRQNIYLACEELDFSWDESEIIKFDQAWREGMSVEEIAKYFRRDADEVALLVIDRARKGHIRRRENGVFGRKMTVKDGIAL